MSNEINITQEALDFAAAVTHNSDAESVDSFTVIEDRNMRLTNDNVQRLLDHFVKTERVKLCDYNETRNYRMFHYNKNMMNSNDYNLFLSQFRGVVFDGDLRAIACRTPYTPTIALSKFDKFIRRLTLPLKWEQARLTSAYEGFLVTVYDQGQLVSTSKCLDATEALWAGGRSFADLFWSVVQSIPHIDLTAFKDKLAKDEFGISHCFFVRHPDVTYGHKNKDQPPILPSISHIASYKGVEEIEYSFEDVHILRPMERVGAVDNDVLQKMFHHAPVQQIGVYLTIPLEHFDGVMHIKVVRDGYNHLSAFANQSKSLMAEYIHAKKRGSTYLQKFLEKNEIYKPAFAHLEKELDDISSWLFELYIQRYCKRWYVYVAEPANFVLKLLHKSYFIACDQKEDEGHLFIDESFVLEFLIREVNPTVIYKPADDVNYENSLIYLCRCALAENSVDDTVLAPSGAA